MLKHRLLYGTLMAVFFTAVAIFDGWMDGSLTASADDKQVQGTILCVLIAVLIILAQLELSRLASAKKLKIFTPVSIIASLLFAGTWYWPQLVKLPPLIYLSFLSAFSLLGLLLYQYFRYGTSDVIATVVQVFFPLCTSVFSAALFLPSGLTLAYGRCLCLSLS
ncbi:MAG TPA: hypothetical protein HPP66_08980 [Planctomycetes bacterium]|nr:hypothetical protein [Planctomycetota bacterium]